MEKNEKERLEPEEEEEEKPRTLWDMFLQYIKEKEKESPKRLVEAT